MVERYPELRGAIYAQYRTKKAFAEALGWKSQRLYNVLQGRIELKRTDIRQIKLLLRIPDDRVSSVFLLSE
jgi:hypothetical protein